MLITTGIVVAAVVALPAQAESAAPGILDLLEAGREAALVERIRSRPDAVREAFARLLELSVHATGADARVRRLRSAEQLAGLYEQVWADSFFVGRVRQFTGWSTDERAEKLEADSLRLAGNDAYRTRGPEAAIELWERSLTKSRVLGDLAGQAAVLGNLGAGYYARGQLERALRYYTRAAELAEEAGDHRTRGNALGNIASVHRFRGDLALAAEFYGRALEVRPLTGDREGQGADLNNLALVRADLGDLRGAEEQLRDALALNRSDRRDGAAANNLTNLANIATERGDYAVALELYVQALEARRRAGDRQGEALDLENLGLLHLRWGDYRPALRSLEESLAILAEIGPATRRAEVRADIAAVRAAMGDLQSALEELDYADAEAGDDEYLAPMLLLQRADLLADLNDDRLAAELYRRAEAAFARIDDPFGQAEAEQGLGYLYMSREDYRAAEEALTQALRVQETFGDPRPAALTRVLLGDAHLMAGDTAGARQAFEQALAVHAGLGDVAAEARTLGAIADLDREMGSLDAAAAGYRAGLARLEDAPAQPIRWQLRFGLGRTLLARGRLDEAATELRAAVAELERVGSTFAVEERRYRYLADKWSVYAELARTELARGRPADAFQASESMRARQLLDLLARGRTDRPGRPEALVRQEQTLRRRISDLTARLDESFAGPSPRREPSDHRSDRRQIRESLRTARAEYEELLVKVKASRPEYASLVTGSPVRVDDLQRVLPSDAVLIEYLVAEDWTIAFVVSGTRIAAVELPVTRDRLGQLVRFFRGTVKPVSGDAVDELWRTPLRSLHHLLLAPLENAGYLEGKRTLIIAPHAELHYLPFAALLEPGPGGETFLIESYDVAYAPSASVWTRLARRRPVEGRGLLAMAPLPDALPNSVREVRAISHGDRGAEVAVGPAATETRFMELAPGRRILHLATAGVLNNRNPLFSYVRLQPGPTADGRLEVHEVFGLELAADLVVLSACETGLGTGSRREVPPGDDWVGLVRAFLFAGAESVVASLWPVEDEVTARLMQEFYKNLGDGPSKARALAHAQRAFIYDEKRSSPFYWAAFGLTGDVQ